MKPAPVKKTRVSDDRVDEVRIQKIKKKAVRTSSIWEIELAFSPTPVKEKKEKALFSANACSNRSPLNNGFRLSYILFEISSDTSEFRNHFLGFLEKHGALPKEILVGNNETLQNITPIALLLKINVKSDSELLAMEEFNHAMFDFFRA
jgi:hypothetical protein